MLAIGCANGTLILANQGKRVEKKEEKAHEGAIINLKWNMQAGLATSGEDGLIKMWNKSGIYRSTLVESSSAIYSICWSPDNNNVLYTSGKSLYI